MSEDFDPDAYLAEKAKESEKAAPFDPEAYLLEQAKANAPRVGPRETFTNKFISAVPLGRLATNALSTGALQAAKLMGTGEPGATLTPQAKAELEQMGETVSQENAIPGVLDTYRGTRDRFDERTAAGSEQNPWTSGAGTVVGTGLSLLAPLPKVKVGGGATAGSRIASNAATGAAYGALNAATNGRADLTQGDLLGTLSETLGVEGLRRAIERMGQRKPGAAALEVLGAGAIGGGLAGGVVGAGLEGLNKIGLIPALSEALRKLALNQGRKVLTNGANSARAPVSDAAVEASIRAKTIKPFGTTEGTFTRLGDKTDDLGAEYGRVVQELEAIGVKGEGAPKIANELVERAAKLEPHTMNTALPEEYLTQAAELLKKTPHRPLPGHEGPSGTLGLKQSENLKSSLQQMAKYGRVEETPVNAIRRDIASVLRRSNEEAIEAAARANPADETLQSLSAQFIPIKQKLGNLYEAEAAAARGAARGADRATFNLTDKMLAAAGLASGNPLATIAAPVANNFFRNRLPSAGASYGLDISDLLKGAPASAGRTGRAVELLNDAVRGPQAVSPQPAFAGGKLSEEEKAQLKAYVERLFSKAGG
jgi:hypothetical protein